MVEMAMYSVLKAGAYALMKEKKLHTIIIEISASILTWGMFEQGK